MDVYTLPTLHSYATRKLPSSRFILVEAETGDGGEKLSTESKLAGLKRIGADTQAHAHRPRQIGNETIEQQVADQVLVPHVEDRHPRSNQPVLPPVISSRTFNRVMLSPLVLRIL